MFLPDRLPMSDPPSDPSAAAAPAAGAALPRVVPSAELLRGSRELRIEHEGEHYTLRLTRLNKLILTK